MVALAMPNAGGTLNHHTITGDGMEGEYEIALVNAANTSTSYAQRWW